MKSVLLTDFGSTYTKLTAVDLDSETILGTASAYTTVQTDVKIGFDQALSRLFEKTGELDFCASYACSSAAGGLRMVVSGLVPELTMEAAKIVCLGAGAKIVGSFSFELTEDDLNSIEELHPDIFLLVGGTDGGNTACILHNAKMLSRLEPSFPIIIAGNRTAANECRSILSAFECYICKNVMPKFGTLVVEDAQNRIRELFLGRIIQAKGLQNATSLFSDILMPTPAAVMKAVELLADGDADEIGIGDLVAVDVGGATTDVYSITEGMPREMNRVFKGIPEPYAKRTVEGDIGMRYSLNGILDAAGTDRMAALSGLCPQRINELIGYLMANTAVVPSGLGELESLDFAAASLAVETAMVRHAGTIEQTYTMMGLTLVQTGKDLSNVKRIVITGGSLIHSPRVLDIAAHALYSPLHFNSLLPKSAEVWLDKSYILAAMGLLSEHHPKAALHIMKKELCNYGYPQPQTV